VTLGLLLLLFALGNLAGLIYYRKNKNVLSGSYIFLVFIVIGVIVSYIAVIFKSLAASKLLTDTLAGSNLCTTSIWLEYLGFFGFLFALIYKSVRIYLIFMYSIKKPKLAKVWLSTGKSVIYYVVAMLVIIFVLFLWTTIDMPQNVKETVNIEYYTEGNSKTSLDYFCESSSSTFHILAISLQCITLAVAVVVAVAVRHIPSAFNESKFLGFAAYNLLVYIFLVLLFQFVIENHQVGYILNIINLLSSTLVLILIVSIKLYYAHKGQEPVVSTMTLGNATGATKSTNESLPLEKTITNVTSITPIDDDNGIYVGE